jgi:hypothetical protein
MAIKYDPILDALREADTSGSSDTASNLGTGTGIFSNKNSGVFYFNSLATSTTIGVSGPTSGDITLNLLSIPSALIPDPLTINGLSVNSNASINNITGNTATITDIFTDTLNFNTSYAITGNEPIGSSYWNIDTDTLEVLTNSGAVQVGEDLFFHCINQTGSNIAKGVAVMYDGALGASGKIKIAPAVANGTYPSIVILGITKEAINNGDEGKVLVVGQIKGINTSVYGTAGQILYIDPATPGSLTTTPPSAPNLKYPIAATLDSKNNGNLAVRAIFTPNLSELNDVQIGTLAGNDVLSYNSTNTRWENKSLATLKTDLNLSGTNSGDVSVTDSSTIDFTLTGQALTGSVIPGGINHNDLGSKQGGTTGEYYHLTNAQITNLNNQSGTNTGDVTVTDSSTVDFTLTGQALTGSVIESGITHNNLGSLQGGTAGEYNHLTNAQVTNLNNQSGTNTGDETKTSIETKLGVATSTNSGYLSSTDWSTFNGKLTPNSPITGDTKTKITYDANGLVTAGADATTADITDSTNKRYVTDAQQTVLTNTSGTNTGDITVTDSSTIDFTLTGQSLTASTKDAGIQHNALIGLTTGDVHTQYAFLSGRSGGQSLHGSNIADQLLILRGTSANGNTLTNNAIRFGVQNGGGQYALDLKHNGDLNQNFGNFNNKSGYLNVNENNNVPPISADVGDILAGSSESSFQYDSEGNLYFDRYTDTPGTTPNMFFRKARGTASSKTTITAGDDIGNIRARSYDGTTFDEIARIQFETSTAQNSGVISFHTSNAGAVAGQRVTIREDGDVGIGIAAPLAKLHIDQTSTSAAIPVLTLDQADIDDQFINFIGTSAADNTRSISTAALGTYAGKVRVEINGVLRWIPFYNT